MLLIYVRKRELSPAGAALGSWMAAADGQTCPCLTGSGERTSCFQHWLWTCALKAGTNETPLVVHGTGGDCVQHDDYSGLAPRPASVETKSGRDAAWHGTRLVVGHPVD